MKRYCDLSDITDGKLYQSEDWVNAGTDGCEGCSQCCQNVGDSIVLDPYDIYELTTHRKVTLQELLADKLELKVVDGLILPNIKTETTQGGCGFLDSFGRCSIHDIRPGFCRMFPLGRYYENNSFHYILQVHECPYPNKTKVQIEQWMGIADLEQYENFVCDWHYYIKELQENILTGLEDTLVRQINLYVLQNFYLLPYEEKVDFYNQFYSRLERAKKEIVL